MEKAITDLLGVVGTLPSAALTAALLAGALASVIVLSLTSLRQRRLATTSGVLSAAPPAPPQARRMPAALPPAESATPPVVLVGDHARSAAGEAFRSLRTQLLLAVRDGNLRHLQITSTGPGEGKTTVAANTAAAVARAGHRVLLVDADLHRPRLHAIFGAPAERGLATLLQMGEAGLRRGAAEPFLAATPIANLKLLPAGGEPSAAAEVLCGNSLRPLMESLAEEFDLIVYDTPPVLSVADPTVLAAQVDGVLLVVRVGQYPRDAIQQAHAELAAVDAKLLGAVLNGVESGTGAAYHGHYRYSYY